MLSKKPDGVCIDIFPYGILGFKSWLPAGACKPVLGRTE